MRAYQTDINEVERAILAHRPLLFDKPQEAEYAVLLFSGGMDSVIGAHMLLEKTKYSIAPLYIDRNARSRNAEIASAKKCAKVL